MTRWIRGTPLCLFALCLPSAIAQPVISTVAGADWLFPGDGKPAVDAPLSGLFGLGLAIDPQGNLHIADPGNNMVLRVGPDGIVNVVAGNGVNFASGDGGLAVNAALLLPTGVAFDPAGNAYICEIGNNVSKVTPQGIISIFAGTQVNGFGGDNGPATEAMVNGPFDVAADSAGNVYIADTYNNRIRKVSPDGIITTVAGNGQTGVTGENVPATSTPIEAPSRIAVDGNGNLYIVEGHDNRLMRMSPDGILTTFAGGGDVPLENAPATNNALFAMAVAVDAQGNVYAADVFRMGVVKIGPDGILTTIAGGTGAKGFAGDGGPATKALFRFVAYPALAADARGNVYVADDGNSRVRRIDPQGVITTIAGNGFYHFSGDGGPATSATLNRPVGVAADANGNLYIGDSANNRIRRVAPDGAISVLAGTGEIGYSGDEGPATSARLFFPTHMEVDSLGNLLFADSFNCAIRFVDPQGNIHSYAGGQCGSTLTDGTPALDAVMGPPAGIALNTFGQLFIADSTNNRLLLVDTPDIRIYSIAGDGTPGFSGDNGKSAAARINSPEGVAVHGGAVYFSDSGNHRVRRIGFTDLIITTVAGNGTAGHTGDGGPATAASLDTPDGLAFDAQGNLFISDSGNGVIRKVTPDGAISTVAGYRPASAAEGHDLAKQSTAGLLKDGHPALEAVLGLPRGIAVDAAGNLLITEFVFDRVRAVLASAPSFQVSPQDLAFTAPAGADAVDQTVTVAGSITGTPFMVSTSAEWLTATPAAGSMPGTLHIAADPSSLAPGAYTGTVTVSAPTANPSTRTISVALTVTAPGSPSLSVSPNAVRFSFVRQSPAQTKRLAVSNAGGGMLDFRAIAATTAGGAWLSVEPASGSLGAYAASSVNVTANPGGLAPGTYSGAVTLENADASQRIVVPVTMTVSAVQQTIRIPQSGLTFYAVEGAGDPPPQLFNVLNAGLGQMTYSVSASTTSGGSWLSALPETGLSDADSPLVPQVRVDVQPEGLSAGVYYGTVQVAAPSAGNSPQFVSVILNVLQRGSRLGPLVQPTGLIFTSIEGGTAPGSQTVTLQSTDSDPLTFTSGRVTANGQNWFTSLPAEGTLTAQQPQRIVIQPLAKGLPAGVYRGSLTLSFSDGSSRSVALVLVVVPAGPSNLSRLRSAAGVCTPTLLAPVFTQLSAGFSVTAGYPGQVAVKVVDDCGAPMTTGGVIVHFSNGDPPLRLDSLKDGSWAATWVPERVTSPTTVTAEAAIPELDLKGQVQITGDLRENNATPIVGSGAIVNTASYSQQGLSPGSFVTLYGTSLAQGPSIATSVPLPASLGGSTVFLAGREAPVYYADSNQVIAILPYGIQVNTDQQMLVSHDGRISTPQPVTIAPAAPGVFTQNQQGTGQGSITVLQGAEQPVADASHPAHPGDFLVIYCTGLGEVDPPVEAGTVTPTDHLSPTVNPVGVTIGGVPATVNFAGLTPGSVGLYQVNAVVPDGVPPGDAVEVVITAAGQASRPVTVSVQ